MEGNERKHLSRIGQMSMIADNFSGHASRPRPRPRLCADNERSAAGKKHHRRDHVRGRALPRDDKENRRGGAKKTREEREEKV